MATTGEGEVGEAGSSRGRGSPAGLVCLAGEETRAPAGAVEAAGVGEEDVAGRGVHKGGGGMGGNVRAAAGGGACTSESRRVSACSGCTVASASSGADTVWCSGTEDSGCWVAAATCSRRLGGRAARVMGEADEAVGEVAEGAV